MDIFDVLFKGTGFIAVGVLSVIGWVIASVIQVVIHSISPSMAVDATGAVSVFIAIVIMLLVGIGAIRRS